MCVSKICVVYLAFLCVFSELVLCVLIKVCVCFQNRCCAFGICVCVFRIGVVCFDKSVCFQNMCCEFCICMCVFQICVVCFHKSVCVFPKYVFGVWHLFCVLHLCVYSKLVCVLMKVCVSKMCVLCVSPMGYRNPHSECLLLLTLN